MADQDMIQISKERYTKLLIAEMELNRLQAGGVDDWTWYGDSLNPDDEPDYDTMCQEIRDNVALM